MQKIYYIAGPMTGLENFNKDAFNFMQADLEEQGHVVLNPAILPVGLKPAQYLDICIPMLRCCTHIVMLEGWKDSKGANIERLIALYNPEMIIEYAYK